MRITCLLVVAFFLTFCSDLKKTKQLEQLDRLNESLDSIELVFKNSGETQLLEISSKGKKRLDELSQIIHHDTIFEKEAIAIASFSQNLKDLSSLKVNFDKLLVQIKVEKQAIINLKKDISQGFGKRHKYNFYIHFERNNVNKLSRLMEEFNKTKMELMRQTKENAILIENIYLKQKNKVQN